MGSLEDIKDIMRGALASLGGFGGRMIARLALMITAGHLYGAAPLGVLGQVAAITEILAAVAVLGLRRSLLDMMSEDEKNGRDPARTFVAALVVSMGLGALMSVTLGLAWPILFPDFSIPVALYAALPCIVFAEVAGTAIRFKRIIRWEVIARCVMEPWAFFAAAALFYLAGFVESGLIMAYAVSAFAAALGILLGLRHAYGFSQLRKAGISWRHLVSVPRHSFAVGITDIGVMMFRRMDILILSLVVGHSATGIYYMAQQIVTVPHKIHQLFEPMLSPVIAKLHHQIKRELIGAKLSSICRWVFMLQLSVTVPFAVFSGEILGLFGSDFSAGIFVLVALLFAELLDGSFALTETPLVYASPRIPPKLIIAALVIEMVSIAALSSLWGVVGAAVGFLAAMAFLSVARLAFLHKSLSITVVDWSYIRPVIFGVVIGAGLLALQSTGLSVEPQVFGPAILGAIAVFLLMIRMMGLTPMDRRVLSQLRAG